MKKIPRLVYEIRFEDGRWRLFAPDGEPTQIGQFAEEQHPQGRRNGSKKEVVASASACLVFVSRDLRIPFELVIKTKDGEIEDKRTYGEDPRRTRG